MGARAVLTLCSLVIVAVFGTGCGTTEGDSDQVEALDLGVGDCFNQPDADSGTGGDADRVRTVTVVPCDELHRFEVYHAFDLDDGPYPGPSAIEEAWIAGCLPEFEAFVGSAFDESSLDIQAIFPTMATWNDPDLADREVLCSVTPVNGEPSTGSAAGLGI